MTSPLASELKPAYRAWCTLILKEWEISSTWGRLLAKAQAQKLPLDQLPTTIGDFVHYKTPLRAVIADRFPSLSKKLFDAEDSTDRAMVLLWLMQNPQAPVSTQKKSKNPFEEVRREVKHNQHVIQSDSMSWQNTKDATAAGTHVQVRGAQSRNRFPGR